MPTPWPTPTWPRWRSTSSGLAEAEAELRRAQALAPDDPEVLRVSGYLLESQQDYAAAVEQYEQAIEQRPRWAHLRVSLGHALRVLRRYDEAIASFVEGADLAPGDPRPEGGLGMVYFDQEDYPTAADHFQRAIEIDPTYPTGDGQLANIYYQRRDYAHAQPLFERAIELERDPTRNASYRHALGWIVLVQPGECRRPRAIHPCAGAEPRLAGRP